MGQLFSLITLLLLLFPHVARGATYYVSESGSGDGSGRNKTNCMSVAAHNTFSFRPGDLIYLKGTIDSEVVPPSSGSASGGDIVYDGIEGGEFDAIRLGGTSAAVINRHNESRDKDSSSYYGILIRNKSFITITDLVITECSNGIVISRGSKSITVKDCYIYNIGWRGIFCTSDSFKNRNRKIVVGGQLGDGCTIRNVGSAGSLNGYAIQGYLTDGMIISWNHIFSDDNNYGITGVSSDYWENVIVEFNEIHGMNKSGGEGENAIGTKSGSNLTFRYNHLYDCPEASGIQLAGNVRDVFIYGNSIHHCRRGIYVFSGAPETWSASHDGVNPENLHIWSNVIYNNGPSAGIIVGHWLEKCDGKPCDPVEKVHIYNNVLAENGSVEGSTGKSLIFRKGFDKIFIKNNIIYDNRHIGSDHRLMYFESVSGREIVLDYNRYYSSGLQSKVFWGGSDTTLSLLKSLYGQERNGSEGDPEFSNAHSDSYTLSTNSTLKNQGFNLGSNYEVGLDPNVTNWNNTPPSFKPARRTSRGFWALGPYVYSDSATGFPAPQIRISSGSQ